jgi:hypothetical protein
MFGHKRTGEVILSTYQDGFSSGLNAGIFRLQSLIQIDIANNIPTTFDRLETLRGISERSPTHVAALAAQMEPKDG